MPELGTNFNVDWLTTVPGSPTSRVSKTMMDSTHHSTFFIHVGIFFLAFGACTFLQLPSFLPFPFRFPFRFPNPFPFPFPFLPSFLLLDTPPLINILPRHPTSASFLPSFFTARIARQKRTSRHPGRQLPGVKSGTQQSRNIDA